LALRRRQLPQALPRQSIRTRRTQHRTAHLRLDHLPPADARSSPTSPTSSPPASAATPYPRSH